MPTRQVHRVCQDLPNIERTMSSLIPDNERAETSGTGVINWTLQVTGHRTDAVIDISHHGTIVEPMLPDKGSRCSGLRELILQVEGTGYDTTDGVQRKDAS